MVRDVAVALLWAGALGSGLMAGTLFAFSSFVMAALASLPAAQGVAAMQAINRLILRSSFMPVFLGSALVGLALMITAIKTWGEPGTPATAAAGALLVVGLFGCTAALNVPLNNTLQRVDAESAEAVAAWRHYRRAWTRWNHLRTVAALAACVHCIAGLRAG